jgi:hypothetical protein
MANDQRRWRETMKNAEGEKEQARQRKDVDGRNVKGGRKMKANDQEDDGK